MPKYMIAVHGPRGSGATQLSRRFLNKPYQDNHTSIIDVVESISWNDEIELQYWDFAPLDTKENQAIKLKLSSMNKICITFDASDPNWQQTLNTYLKHKEVKFPVVSQLGRDGSREPAIPVILVGTKVDSLTNKQQTDLQTQATEYAENTLKTQYFMPVSAKTDVGINELKSLIMTGLANLDDVTQNKNRENPNAAIASLGAGSRVRGETPLDSTQSDGALGTKVPQPPAGSGFSFALRIVGLALMVAAVVNLVYLALIAANVLSAVALTTAMSHVLVTAGVILGVTAPAVAFANVCAAWGISTTAATTMIAAASTMLVGLAGYGVFRCGKPAASTQDLVNEQRVAP